MYIDISAVARTDLKTGIERVVRAVLMELIRNPPSGYDIKPVYLDAEGHRIIYRHARQYMANLIGEDDMLVLDEIVEPQHGDIFLGVDLYARGVVQAAHNGLYEEWRAKGVSIHFIVYDLLPVQRPDVFPPGTDKIHEEWLKSIAIASNSLICISRSVADELQEWLRSNALTNAENLLIGSFHLGADVAASMPSVGLPVDAQTLLKHINAGRTFLMVGTIEPRKGYLQVLEAFSSLWEHGIEINLVIVGHEGWTTLPDDQRRTIPLIISKLRNHSENDRHLFWLEGISDEYLEKIYDASDCLIAASEGEGFGLPLIEAAQHKMPIIARDIPVFRELAGEHAFYFSGLAPENLADAVTTWIALNQKDIHPKSDSMHYLTWRESVIQLKDRLNLMM